MFFDKRADLISKEIEFRGGKGSHHIYVREGVEEMLNFQNVGGKAKLYRVKPFIRIIEKYNLVEEEKYDV